MFSPFLAALFTSVADRPEEVNRHDGGREGKHKNDPAGRSFCRGCSIPVAEQKQQDHHDDDNPQEIIVLPVKKTIQKTHGGVPLSFSLQPMQLTRRVS
ncbi:hypothetical protein H1215_09390, partial [Anoxybacillus sp. LAT_38]